MQLENINTRVRPRSNYEAIDLGFALTRRWFAPLFKLWLLWFLPITAIIYGLCLPHSPLLANIIIWCIKPLFDCVLLAFFSHVLFGEQLTWRQSLSFIPKMLWQSGLWLRWILLRFDASRSFELPVYQLERLKGKAKRKRLQLLRLKTLSSAQWLTFICYHIEWIIYISLFMLLLFLTPEMYQQDFWDTVLPQLLSGEQNLPWMIWLAMVFNIISIAFIEPFYVAGGFMLYLNRRTHLEAWDIELSFRQIAKRLS